MHNTKSKITAKIKSRESSAGLGKKWAKKKNRREASRTLLTKVSSKFKIKLAKMNNIYDEPLLRNIFSIPLFWENIKNLFFGQTLRKKFFC